MKNKTFANPFHSGMTENLAIWRQLFGHWPVACNGMARSRQISGHWPVAYNGVARSRQISGQRAAAYNGVERPYLFVEPGLLSKAFCTNQRDNVECWIQSVASMSFGAGRNLFRVAATFKSWARKPKCSPVFYTRETKEKF